MSSNNEVIAWVYGCTDPGAVRTNNEDAFLIADMTSDLATSSSIPVGADGQKFGGVERGNEGMLRKCVVGDRGLLMAVSDGMGGAEAGEIASFMVIESLRERLKTLQERSTGNLVRSAVEQANSDVYEEAIVHPKRAGMGATLTAVYVRRDRAYVAGVGDSRCYVIRDKRIRMVTRDQSLVESLVELGHMSREEAETSPHRNIILQALGTRKEIAVALMRIQVQRGDMLLLCSDGLSGKIADEELCELALNGPTLDEACRKMVEIAKERGGEDNITVILAHFSGAGLYVPQDPMTVTGTLQKIYGFNHAAGVGYEQEGGGGPATPPATSGPADGKKPARTEPLSSLPPEN